MNGKLFTTFSLHFSFLLLHLAWLDAAAAAAPAAVAVMEGKFQ